MGNPLSKRRVDSKLLSEYRALRASPASLVTNHFKKLLRPQAGNGLSIELATRASNFEGAASMLDALRKTDATVQRKRSMRPSFLMSTTKGDPPAVVVLS